MLIENTLQPSNMTPKHANLQKKKRNSLTLKDKVKVLQTLDDKEMTKADIANKFNIHPTTVRKIQKNAQSILRAASNRNCRRTMEFKYASSGAYKNLEDTLYLWFLNQRRINKTVSSTMIILKAKYYLLNVAGCRSLSSFRDTGFTTSRWDTVSESSRFVGRFCLVIPEALLDFLTTSPKRFSAVI